MTARNFLVRGLLVGLLSGFAAFLVAHQVGEPHVDTAIALEEANAAADAAPADHSGSSEEDAGPVVSRANQSTWGLLTGTLPLGTVLGGFVALLAAMAAGRLGRLSPVQSTAVVAAIGFVSYSLVPFLKYPANPPAVGNPDTIGTRSSSYFALVLISVVVAVAAVLAARAAAPRLGGLRACVLALVGYVALVSLAVVLLPTVDEVGDFPGDTLWAFRVSSLLTLAAMWSVIGIGLALAVDRLAAQDRAVADRRAFAASL
ncbi:CbtA family protein [Nocardioides plantarum]|uniref:CbtA family protein n=1 Tax=Nocardioides plantarum TaxID=29299 RepID=A0ABV5KEU8_9ACTN|nr:CbtA family protein [Nocardioides plantarum]